VSAKVPQDIRDKVKATLWAKADQLGWDKMSDLDRAAWYENWAKDKDVGGVLSHFMDPRRVRVYIKDSLLKPYSTGRLEACLDIVLGALRLPPDVDFKALYDKPHGRMLLDGRVFCWGKSRDWKMVLMSVFERAYRTSGGSQYAAVFFETGQSTNEGMREMIKAVATRLGLADVIWID
jgi:hypothetical protein